MIIYLKELLSLLGDDVKKIPLLILFFFGSAILDVLGIGLIAPYVALVMDADALNGRFGFVFELFNIPREHSKMLIVIGLGLLGTFIIRAAAAIWVNGEIIKFSTNQTVRMSTFLMRSYQSLPYTEYLKRNSSEYIYSIQVLTSKFSMILILLLKAVSDGIVVIAIVLLLAFKDINALLILMILLGSLVWGYDHLLRTKIKNYGKKANISATSIVQRVQEGIDGLKEIRVLGKEKYFLESVSNAAEEFSTYSAKTQILSAIPRFLLELMMIAFVVALVISTVLTGGDVLALTPTLSMFAVAALRLLPSANTLANTLIQLRHSRDSISRLFSDVKNLQENKVANYLNETKGICRERFISLDLNKIYYSYPGEKKSAINDISLKIKSGESIGIIGASGSGKTTLINIMLGLIKPTKGKIVYNGVETRKDENYWNNQVAYLPQEIFLIDNSLRNNIGLGVDSDEIDNEKIYDSLIRSKLIKLTKQLPEGVETLIGERGARLSGGQRQRVSLARAFYHGRSVLVMDEATSALDSETEREIVNEIEKLRGENTMIIIAHRLSTLQHCDRIYQLIDGAVVKEGSYEMMVSRKTTTED
jgi:ATP-binding cassette, subfamily B, bacterial PglK